MNIGLSDFGPANLVYYLTRLQIKMKSQQIKSNFDL